MTTEVHITNGAIEQDDEFTLDVLRGTLDQATFKNLNFDWYQREQGFRESEIKALMELFFANKKVTDITLGMRGERMRVNGTEIWLQDKCYVVDGGQRLWAAAAAVQHRPSLQLRIGAKIYFPTTMEIENEMFCSMNATQQRVSASVLMRNKYKESDAAQLLYKLNRDDTFALKERIGWGQKLGAGEALSGYSLGCITGALHAERGSMPAGRAYDLLTSLDNACIKVGGPDVMSANIIKFFDLVDECWGVRNNRKPAELHRDFLTILARLFASYDNFWDGDELYLASKYTKKLAKFDSAPAVKAMVKNNKEAKDVLFTVLQRRLGLDNFNGRRRPPPGSTAGARVTP